MSLDIIKSVFQNLNAGTNWSLQLLNIRTSKRTGTGYSSRQIILTPNKRLAVLINDIAAINMTELLRPLQFTSLPLLMS